ncbi:MAG: HD domain-containing protein [Candidatus Hydrothermia bacterium]
MQNFLDFLEEAYRLKRTPRAGFWYYGVENPESVAEHIFGVSLITYITAKLLLKQGEKLDVEKAIKMAVIHELGEALIGDIHLEARRYIGKSIESVEHRAFHDLVSKLPEEVKNELLDLYKEFENGETVEAKIVRAADKVDLLIQAYLYEKTGHRNLESFFNEDKNYEFIKQVPFFSELIETLKKRREK